jgi:type I restriction enzyme R subunit
MTPPRRSAPEERAREKIDAALVQAGWVVQDRDDMNLAAGRGVAVREFALASGYGFADYLLFVDGKAAGVLEAKPADYTLTGVEVQVARYASGLPSGLNPCRSDDFDGHFSYETHGVGGGGGGVG